MAPEFDLFRPAWEHDVHHDRVNSLVDRQPDRGQVNYPSNARGRFFHAGVKMNLDQRPF